MKQQIKVICNKSSLLKDSEGNDETHFTRKLEHNGIYLAEEFATKNYLIYTIDGEYIDVYSRNLFYLLSEFRDKRIDEIFSDKD